MTLSSEAGYHRRAMKDWKYNWAFVIQFQPETDLEAGRCKGRVEHITSYKAARFCSIEELLSFVAQVLTEMRAGEEQNHEETA